MSFKKIDFKKYIAKGIEMAKGNPIEEATVKPLWVKKYVGQREWNDKYSQTSSYCNLGSEGVGKEKRIKVGFLVAGIIPRDCEMMIDEELMAVDSYRRGSNIWPVPLKKVNY